MNLGFDDMIKYDYDEGNNNKVSWSLIQHQWCTVCWRGKYRMNFVKVQVMLFVHYFPLSWAKIVIYSDSTWRTSVYPDLYAATNCYSPKTWMAATPEFIQNLNVRFSPFKKPLVWAREFTHDKWWLRFSCNFL